MNVEACLKTEKKIPLPKRTLIHLQLVASRLHEDLSETLKPFDVSLQQFNVLRILRGQKGNPATLQTISERMVNKMSNTTRLVDKLIAKGLVRRDICPSNRRKVDITITNKGLEVLKEMDLAMNNTESRMLTNFSETELQEINRLFDKLYN
ncbi:MarR family winged helix-turn-helix transcriptional regulator [Spongiivirga citrea]|uniref:MarR family transcriptional regulator n=1 Tax=Spongiivirga citrea TaxID=1481457 RepID=A0A6M0CRD9_9FLAO|nr:MarR family transcriptional regulator [Spongiivirga citrea]NER18429.1 MarR family transcriptional regulator [Spongiivirga citrea]